MSKSMLFSLPVDSIRIDLNHGDLITSPPFSKKELLKTLVGKLKDLGYKPEDISKIEFVNKDGVLYLEGLAYELQPRQNLEATFI